MAVGVLGILKSGAAYVPLDPALPRDRLAHLVGGCGLQLVVTDGSTEQNCPTGSARSTSPTWPVGRSPRPR
jgi:non-ribosomal peptide synthetase component F